MYGLKYIVDLYIVFLRMMKAEKGELSFTK